ncbi:T9SS type A sorting domain-containing protein [candidate division KSB1 bacterium]|nr:T9SS type A sorting domain-containing protein [candidate division KSB1 bacterium]
MNKSAQTLAAKSLITLPEEYSLQQNYPNPFNPETVIEYHLPQASDVSISIYNIRGQLVRTLVNGYKEAGIHHAIWNSTDATGADIVSGIYLYRIKATGEDGRKYSFTRRMVLLK